MRKVLENAWLPSLVTGLIAASLLQWTRWGVVAAVAAAAMYAVGSHLFDPTSAPAERQRFYRLALRYNHVIATLLLLISCFFCVRPFIATDAKLAIMEMSINSVDFLTQGSHVEKVEFVPIGQMTHLSVVLVRKPDNYSGAGLERVVDRVVQLVLADITKTLAYTTLIFIGLFIVLLVMRLVAQLLPVLHPRV